MTTIQERLQLKRAPLDKWTTREKLCLASAVCSSGDQNWMNVSRTLKLLCNENQRPADWYSQKSCAAQYGDLLENADTPKRKKRSNSESAVTPTEQVLKRLTDERISELKMQIQKDQEEYAILEEEINALESENLTDAELMEMWKKIEAEQVQKIIDQEKYNQMLKDREEKKLEMLRQWKPTIQISKSAVQSTSAASKTEIEDMEIDDTINPQPITQPPSSPLLTSLLKSGQGPPASVTSPTITNLLTGGVTPTPQSTSTSTSSSQQAPRSSLVVVSAEHIQKPTSVQTPSQTAPTLSMLLEKKEDGAGSSAGNESLIKDEEQQLLEEFNGLIPDNIDELAEMITKDSDMILEGEEGIDAVLLEDPDVPVSSPVLDKEATESTEVKKEIEGKTVKEEDQSENQTDEKVEAIKKEPEQPEVISSDESSDNTNLQALKEKAKSEESIVKKEEVKEEESKEESEEQEKDVEEVDEEIILEVPIEIKSDDPEMLLEMIHQSPEQEEKPDIQPDDEDQSTLQPLQTSKSSRKLRERERSESPIIDDDGATDSSTSFRSRRRYSSTPVNDSHPSSPAPSSDDKETRVLKKSLLLLCTKLEKSKYSSIFMKSTPDSSLEDIIRWKSVCLKPIDLPTLRKNVESGQIKTTVEFFRGVYVMCYNMILFFREDSKSTKGIYKQAIKFLEEVKDLEENKEGKCLDKEKSTSNSALNLSSGSSKSRSSSRKSQRF